MNQNKECLGVPGHKPAHGESPSDIDEHRKKLKKVWNFAPSNRAACTAPEET